MRTDEQTLSDLQDRRQKLLVGGELHARSSWLRYGNCLPTRRGRTFETELQVLDNVHNLVQPGEEIHDLLYQRDGSVYEQLSQVRRRIDRILESIRLCLSRRNPGRNIVFS